MLRHINGILLLDKPAGFTSNQALQRVKRLFNAKKAGHTGSLDPLATGMLPLCFGEATKFSQFLLESDKTYYVVAKLGIETTTGDSEGDIVQEKPVGEITRTLLESMLAQFQGELQQIPPMFSAIKHQGKPLYKLARSGIQVERAPRKITIFSTTLEEFTQDEFRIHVHCSKGTYIRTLIEEMGKVLGCGAHVCGLRRLSVKPYGHVPMHSLPTLEKMAMDSGVDALLSCLLGVETAVNIYPAVKLTTAAAFYLRMGQPVRANFPIESSLVRLISEDSRFIGMGEVLSDGRVKPHRLLASLA